MPTPKRRPYGLGVGLPPNPALASQGGFPQNRPLEIGVRRPLTRLMRIIARSGRF